MYYMTYAIPFEKLQETGAVISGNAFFLRLLISPTDLVQVWCCSFSHKVFITRASLSCSKPHFQSEAKCKAIDMKMIFYFHANKIHFQKKHFEYSLVLKVRVFEHGNGQLWNIYAQDFNLVPRSLVSTYFTPSQSSQSEKLNFLTWSNLAFGFVDKRSGYEINKISAWMVCTNGIKAPQNSTVLTT